MNNNFLSAIVSTERAVTAIHICRGMYLSTSLNCSYELKVLVIRLLKSYSFPIILNSHSPPNRLFLTDQKHFCN